MPQHYWSKPHAWRRCADCGAIRFTQTTRCMVTRDQLWCWGLMADLDDQDAAEAAYTLGGYLAVQGMLR